MANPWELCSSGLSGAGSMSPMVGEVERAGQELDPLGWWTGESRELSHAHWAPHLQLGQVGPYLKHCLGSVALHIVPVDDNLNDAVPHLFAHIVAGNPD